MATLEELQAELARRQQGVTPDQVQAELARRQQPAQPAQQQEFDPLRDISAFGVTAEDVIGTANLAQNIATGIPARASAGLQAIPDILQGEVEQGIETIERATGQLQTPLSESGQKVAAKLGETIKELGDNPAFSGIVEQLKRAQSGFSDILKLTGAFIADPIGLARSKTSGQPLSERAQIGEGIGEALGVAIPKTAAEVSAFAGVGAPAAAARQAGRIPSLARATESAVQATKAKTITDDVIKNISNTIKKGTDDELAAIVNADKEFFRAADELGISVEPLASFASKNPQFRAVESGLASVPGSALDVQTKAFIGQLSQKADNLIEKFGGTLDKGQLNLDFKRTALSTIDDLAVKADDVYGSIAKILPKSNRFDAPETVGFIESKAKELGGVKELPSRLKGMLNNLKTKTKTTRGKKIISVSTGARVDKPTITTTPPTLGKIDQTRREIGQALNKKSGPFKDTEEGLLKALYNRLTKDQDAIAQGAGFGEITEGAKGLIRQRKQLEDNLSTLLGKDLNKALSINVSGALKGLAKNDIQRFRQVMDAIPKNQRGEIVLSAMNDVFRGSGVGQQSLNPTQFVKWFQNINRSPAVKKELFDALPQGSQRAVENLFKVSSGVSKALGDRVTTGRLNAMFNEDTGFLRNMVGRAAPSMVAIATGSPIASAATSASVEFLRQGTNGAKRASDLLASTQFQAIIRRSVKEGVIEGNKVASQGLQKAEAAIKNTKPYKEWFKTLNKDQQQGIQNTGLVTYLFASNVEEQ